MHIDGIRLDLVEKVFSAVSQGSGGVGGADEGEGSAVLGVLEDGHCIFEGVVSVGHSVIDVAFDVGVSDESVDDLRAHQIIISNTK